MAVTSTPILAGESNAVAISYDPGTSKSALLDEIETQIGSRGWPVFDASAGTNMRAYRATNFDGSTHKYVTLDLESVSGGLILRNWELWDAVAHSGTNPSWDDELWDGTTGKRADLNQRVDLTNGGTLFVYAKSEYLVLYSQISAGSGSVEGNAFTAVIEVERFKDADTPSLDIPAGAWMAGANCSTPSLVAGSFHPIAFPRLRGGTTGNSASHFGVTISPGIFHAFLGGFRSGSDGPVPSIGDQWDVSSQAFISDVIAGASEGSTLDQRGRLRWLKFTQKDLVGLNTQLNVTVDSNTGFLVNSGGTRLPFLLLPCGHDGSFRAAVPA